MKKTSFGMFALLTLSIILCSAAEVGAQKRDSYAGTWTGSFTAANGNKGSLSYVLSKNAKGQWGGTCSFSGDGGQQSAPLKSVRIVGAKFSATLETPDGTSIVAIEGTLQGKRLAGTYAVSSKQSGQKVDGGSWTTDKTS